VRLEQLGRIRTGHVAFHEVDCDRVQAARRNYAAGKQGGVSVADRGARLHGVENIRNQLILNGSARSNGVAENLRFAQPLLEP